MRVIVLSPRLIEMLDASARIAGNRWQTSWEVSLLTGGDPLCTRRIIDPINTRRHQWKQQYPRL